jgi:putative oxidoreductase
MATGLLVARIILGLTLATHGAQKLFGWFGGNGVKGTAGFVEGLGFRPGTLFAAAAGLGEFGGGVLTAAGFLGPVGPALLVLVMLVAIVSVHWGNGFFARSGGIEHPLMNVAAALAIAFAGPGAYSLDGLFGLSDLWRPSVAWTTVGIAVALALLTLAIRHRPEPEPARSHA